MKIITEPSIHVLSVPLFNPHPKYELPDGGTPVERMIATAGKVCYDSYGAQGNPIDQHVQNLVTSEHYSVTEHAHVGLFIEGISRGCSHEIVRHRHFNYSQRSTRYTKEDEAAIVLDPYYADIHERQQNGRTTHRENGIYWNFIDSCRESLKEYREAVDWLMQITEDEREQKALPIAPRDFRKWCRGKARQLLPHALETRMVMTGNLRSWREFIVKRTSRHAEEEMRRLAEKIWQVLWPIAPNVFIDLEQTMVRGFYEVTKVDLAAKQSS